MPKLYLYTGPAHLAKLANANTPRSHVTSQTSLVQWLIAQPDLSRHRTLTATFVLLPDGLWVADRHSEHIACARGSPVHCAGEVTFELNPSRSVARITGITNQSTGYCPEPESWPTLSQTLNQLNIPHPQSFDPAFQFRRCPACQATNIIKDDWFECAVCGGQLPLDWNYSKSPN